ncbi:MAG: hypothetical protein AB7V18_09680 [Pyrinomonadaceae bacterium]
MAHVGIHAQAAKSPYINYEYEGVIPGRSLPNGVIELGGSLIGDIESDPVYSVAHTKKGRTEMLWLVASTGKDVKGITGWKVIDVLSFPTLAKTQYLFFAGDPAIYCRKNGDEIPDLVGVGRIDRKRWRFLPSRLWTADLKIKRFVPLDLAGVKCEYSEP